VSRDERVRKRLEAARMVEVLVCQDDERDAVARHLELCERGEQLRHRLGQAGVDQRQPAAEEEERVRRGTGEHDPHDAGIDNLDTGAQRWLPRRSRTAGRSGARTARSPKAASVPTATRTRAWRRVISASTKGNSSLRITVRAKKGGTPPGTASTCPAPKRERYTGDAHCSSPRATTGLPLPHGSSCERRLVGADRRQVLERRGDRPQPAVPRVAEDEAVVRDHELQCCVEQPATCLARSGRRGHARARGGHRQPGIGQLAALAAGEQPHVGLEARERAGEVAACNEQVVDRGPVLPGDDLEAEDVDAAGCEPARDESERTRPVGQREPDQRGVLGCHETDTGREFVQLRGLRHEIRASFPGSASPRKGTPTAETRLCVARRTLCRRRSQRSRGSLRRRS
jgi:hypothetical protein